MKESEFLTMLARRKTGGAAKTVDCDGHPVEIRVDATTTFIPGRPTPLTEAERAAGTTIPNYWRNRNRPGRLF